MNVRMWRISLILIALLMGGALASPAQTPPARFPFNLDQLAKDAEESVTVTLDRPLIELALKFLPKNDPETAKIRQAVQGLNGIYVRSFQFKNEGAYSPSLVDSMRKQLIGPGWSRIVEVRGKGENVDVSLHQDGEKIMGLVIIAAEAKELTVVSINGDIKPEQLSELEGFAGIPHIGGMGKKSTGKANKESEKPDKEE